jgi:hypothetical protein
MCYLVGNNFKKRSKKGSFFQKGEKQTTERGGIKKEKGEE